MATPPIIKRPMAPGVPGVPGGTITPRAPRVLPPAAPRVPAGMGAQQRGNAYGLTPEKRQQLIAGYTGPRPGTPEFAAARAAGQTPIRDYIKTQIPNLPARPTMPVINRPNIPTGGFNSGGIMPPDGLPTRMPPTPNPNTGIVPPHMNPSPVPQYIAEGGRVKGKGKGLSNASKMLKCTGGKTKAGY